MNNIDMKPQIIWDEQKRILYIDIVGHITKQEMSAIITQVEYTLTSIDTRPIKALHNFKKTEHVSLDAQILFSEYLLNPLVKKHAFVSINSLIRETIDIIILLTDKHSDTMRIFEDDSLALEWLLS